jgi:hypothetical protein
MSQSQAPLLLLCDQLARTVLSDREAVTRGRDEDRRFFSERFDRFEDNIGKTLDKHGEKLEHHDNMFDQFAEQLAEKRGANKALAAIAAPFKWVADRALQNASVVNLFVGAGLAMAAPPLFNLAMRAAMPDAAGAEPAPKHIEAPKLPGELRGLTR